MRTAVKRVWTCGVLACAGVGAGYARAEPVDVSGSVSYAYRALSGTTQDTTSNQLLGSLYANSYIWQPWFATATAGLTLALDRSEVDNASTGGSNSKIATGDLNLNVLPESHVPFQLHYQASDSRVDDLKVRNPLITLSAEDYRTQQLELAQSYITEQGHRIQAHYDTQSWESDRSGHYDNNSVGLDLDWRPAGQRLMAQTSYQTTDQTRADRHQDNLVLNVDHYYFPTDVLRVDSKASAYRLDTNYNGGAGISGSTAVDLAQASSFVFWRPENSPLTASGGVRVYSLQGDSSVASGADQLSISATAGAFYQYTQRLRFDASGFLTTLDTDGTRETTSKLHAGGLYQSDLILLRGFNYEWFLQGAVETQTDPAETAQTMMAAVGHDAQRTWATGDTSFLRLSLSQALNENLYTGSQDSIHRLDHSASLSWSQSALQGTTLVQLTLADMRHLGASEDNEQLFNLQASRTQTVTTRSSLNGNLTVQTVRHSYPGEANRAYMTTATGQLGFEHQRLFGVPRLRFLSNLYMSKASLDGGVDRAEWENRADYTIGLLTSSLSLRLMDNGQDNSSLLYFQITRRF